MDECSRCGQTNVLKAHSLTSVLELYVLELRDGYLTSDLSNTEVEELMECLCIA